VTSRPAAGGGRWVDVAPERLSRWLDGFAERHGAVTWSGSDRLRIATAADGTVAEVSVPFSPLTGDLVEHCLAVRRVGLLLVRLGGHAVGVAEGTRLVTSKVGSRPVHGRSAAGGWSQQRFARRREGQSAVAMAAAADTAARLLLPEVGRLAALVVGGDRGAVEVVLADRRLAPLRGLVADRVLDVPDPRQKVLEAVVARYRDVRMRVVDLPGS
jgi:Actinobacteria/chloroflexi VLRF1 release factor